MYISMMLVGQVINTHGDKYAFNSFSLTKHDTCFYDVVSNSIQEGMS